MYGCTLKTNIYIIYNISNISVNATSQSEISIGGICGALNDSDYEIIGCYNIGEISAQSKGNLWLGGISGTNYQANIINCFYKTNSDHLEVGRNVGGATSSAENVNSISLENFVKKLNDIVTTNIMWKEGMLYPILYWE